MWVAPELLYPDLFQTVVDANTEPNLNVDIYSLGSIILFVRRPWFCSNTHPSVSKINLQILSGKSPWSKAEFEKKADDLQNPPRPQWPVIPDVVWDFIQKCWSPHEPTDRPSAQEVLSFTRDRLQQLLQPKYVVVMIFLLASDS